MQSVIGDVVSEFQSGFIPERKVSDNILLATELIKGYTRAYVSPRCLLKYFDQWKSTKPFSAKKGLRQGDPMSPFLFAIGMEYLTRHLKQLQTQPDFNFHPKCEKLAITHLMFADDLLMFSRADIQFVKMMFTEANLDKVIFSLMGYLGVPLSTKKLAYNQCRPLNEKVVAKAKTWTARNLTYVGRLQFVQTILFSLQSFWCQIFIFPKKVIREIQNFCRIYLWTGHTDPSRRSLVAWYNMCLPRTAGGWNSKEMNLWNKAAIANLL
ncbi:uncharacterized protein [Spinacia oleracea]|uniref:Reverse transcriptase domain-containing protein n=1 Tax=Spinacia oleracea TaxID=3562 RepID=A0ABM3QRT3_SPIOL|nr:uncharacterized protein LOC130461848 [Spinacia oleracea]